MKSILKFKLALISGQVSKMTFDHASFWISITNVLLACMSEVFAREWESLIGEVEDVRVANRVMKVRVRINITRPLKRGLTVATDEKGTEVSLLFQYEHLSKFCYDCGIIGHKALDCPLKDFQANETGLVQSGRYGSWCAPSSSPRIQRQWGGSKQTKFGDESHFMNMREVGRLVEAIKSSMPRRNTEEKVATTSVLKRREREEEIRITLGSETVTGEIPSVQTMRPGAPLVPSARRNTEEECTPIIFTVHRIGESHGNDEIKSCDKGKVVVCSEMVVGKLFQSTFESLVKAQKKKTWKRHTLSLDGYGVSSSLADGMST
ncbi:hypothetical protein F8388_019901 [Cannabis sativa]|uniref:CCHC-type domain-containing protein n=1 Tax=Cannabis sativa TaxID=3483 RepID=A0A7J6H4P5_CANSA|nr:hypothetical protein G4B88_020955 [Cannabis sativa]KAF4390246.1 hypothetical protein F8388_019901 [Cannabis sativa]